MLCALSFVLAVTWTLSVHASCNLSRDTVLLHNFGPVAVLAPKNFAGFLQELASSSQICKHTIFTGTAGLLVLHASLTVAVAVHTAQFA